MGSTSTSRSRETDVGRSVSVDTVYGVEIGNYDGWLFDNDADPFETLGWDEEEVEDEIGEDLLLLFLGHENPIYMSIPERRDALESSRLEVHRGGYEYSTVIVKVRGVGKKHRGWVNKISIIEEGPTVQDANELVRFIEWLDAKGLRLVDDVRVPGWLLVTSYG
jgi:hypothetical protein